MGGRGKTSSSGRGRRRGRKNVKQGKKGEEDRISQLSDDLINHILSFVDSNVAVQTMVLSKRWLNLWTTLSCLNFDRLVSSNYESLVSNFLKNRDQQYVISKFTIDCGSFGGRKLQTTCLDYALSHSVEHLSICAGDLADYPCKISFACLKTLHLILCQNLPVLDYWTLPSLTSLYLEVGSGNDKKNLGFENLKELTLVEYFKGRIDAATITINCPKLQRLTLNPEHRHTFIVSAPSLYYLSYCSRHVSDIFARDGFPCIKQVYIDIRKYDGDFFFKYYYSDRSYWTVLKLAMKKFISMLDAVSETLFLELSYETVEGLRLIYPELSKCKHSSLGNLKFFSLRGPGVFDEQPPRTNYVINYLLSNSPCAKIIRRL